MATIKFTLSNKVRQITEDSEILLRLSICREKTYRLHSGLYVKPGNWDAPKSKIKLPRVHSNERNELAKTSTLLSQLCISLQEEITLQGEKSITKEALEKLIYKFHHKEETVEKMPIVEAFEDFIKKERAGRINHERSILRMIKRFELYRGSTWYLEDATDNDLYDFEAFLKVEHTFFKDGKCVKYKELYEAVPESRPVKQRGGNGIYAIMNSFKTFYNWCEKKGKTKNNPFRNFPVKECPYGTPYYMSLEELDKLYEFDFHDKPELAIQRDIFIFQSNIGCRISDLMELTYDNYINGYIEYVATKKSKVDSSTLRIPVSPRGQEIIKRYKDGKRKTLLPFISKQNYNEAIKKMLRLAHIDRKVTIINKTTRKEEQQPICDVASSHMARRNFIGNLYEAVKDPNIIGSMSGHAPNSKALSRYRTINDKIKEEVTSIFK